MMEILFLSWITLLATTHLRQDSGLWPLNKCELVASTKPWHQYYRKHLEVDETGAAKTYWEDNISSGLHWCITKHLEEVGGHIKQKKGSSNYLRLQHQRISKFKMINLLRKGIKFPTQRVYFPQSNFEFRPHSKRLKNLNRWHFNYARYSFTHSRVKWLYAVVWVI